jgi:hypothetical protein
VKFPVEVEEPLTVVAYPTLLSFYPNTTVPFNITVENAASVNYLVALTFSLNDSAYQQAYAAFSDETYTVIPSLNNLTAWITVAADAPAKALELTVELNRVSAIEPTFSYTFTWTNETQSVVNGTLGMKVDFRLTEENLMITAQINQTEYSDYISLGVIIDQEFDGFHLWDQGYLLTADNCYYYPSETALKQEWFLGSAVLCMPHPNSPYHKCTFDNMTGYTFHVKLPSSVVPEKPSFHHVLRAHIDFLYRSVSVNVEFNFENWPYGGVQT